MARKTTAKKKPAAKKKVAIKKTAAKKVAKKVTRKAAPKKAVARKPAKKVARKVAKKVVKKAAAPKKAAVALNLKKTAIKSAMNKTAVVNELAEMTSLSKKEVSNVMEALANVMSRHIKKGAAGEFTVPGLMKLKVVRKPATKARKGINPFTGEETMFKAKPARNLVKVRPLKKVKEMAA